MELNMNYEEVELFDGVEFTTLLLKSIDENNYLHYLQIKEGGKLREEEALLCRDKNGDYFIYMDFPYLYTDISKVKLLKEKVERLQRG